MIKFFLYFFICLTFLLSLFSIYNVFFPSPPFLSVSSSDCEGMDILDTSHCLNKELKTFFNFNISNTGKELSEEDLLREGGVCEHYARWYIAKIDSLNSSFTAEYVRIEAGSEFDHAFAVVSDSSAYCLLDQTEVYCFEFG